MTETAENKRKSRSTAQQVKMNQMVLFNKHVIEGKTIPQCAKEMDLSPRQLHLYKKQDDYRTMALAHLENSTLRGLDGTVSRLIKMLDAKKPMIKKVTDENGFEQEQIVQVADNKTRMAAMQEVIKIYGLHAPKQSDVKVTVAFSSDADLYSQIEQAERACRVVEQQQTGEGSQELANSPHRSDRGAFETRKRVILQVAPLSESE